MSQENINKFIDNLKPSNYYTPLNTNLFNLNTIKYTLSYWLENYILNIDTFILNMNQIDQVRIESGLYTTKKTYDEKEYMGKIFDVAMYHSSKINNNQIIMGKSDENFFVNYDLQNNQFQIIEGIYIEPEIPKPKINHILDRIEVEDPEYI